MSLQGKDIIRALDELEGTATMPEIITHLSICQDNPPADLSEQVSKALKIGVAYGYVDNVAGYYHNGIYTSEEEETYGFSDGELDFIEACNKKKKHKEGKPKKKTHNDFGFNESKNKLIPRCGKPPPHKPRKNTIAKVHKQNDTRKRKTETEELFELDCGGMYDCEDISDVGSESSQTSSNIFKMYDESVGEQRDFHNEVMDTDSEIEDDYTMEQAANCKSVSCTICAMNNAGSKLQTVVSGRRNPKRGAPQEDCCERGPKIRKSFVDEDDQSTLNYMRSSSTSSVLHPRYKVPMKKFDGHHTKSGIPREYMDHTCTFGSGEYYSGTSAVGSNRTQRGLYKFDEAEAYLEPRESHNKVIRDESKIYHKYPVLATPSCEEAPMTEQYNQKSRNIISKQDARLQGKRRPSTSYGMNSGEINESGEGYSDLFLGDEISPSFNKNTKKRNGQNVIKGKLEKAKEDLPQCESRNVIMDKERKIKDNHTKKTLSSKPLRSKSCPVNKLQMGAPVMEQNNRKSGGPQKTSRTQQSRQQIKRDSKVTSANVDAAEHPLRSGLSGLAAREAQPSGSGQLSGSHAEKETSCHCVGCTCKCSTCRRRRL